MKRIGRYVYLKKLQRYSEKENFGSMAVKHNENNYPDILCLFKMVVFRRYGIERRTKHENKSPYLLPLCTI